jgi:hypothetical protein
MRRLTSTPDGPRVKKPRLAGRGGWDERGSSEYDRTESDLNGRAPGEAAITVLRKALRQIYITEVEIAEYRRLVSAAELQLIYGDEGRPQRLGSTFIEGAG